MAWVGSVGPKASKHSEGVMDGWFLFGLVWFGLCLCWPQCCNTCEEVKNAYKKKGWAFIGLNVEQVRWYDANGG